MPGAVLDPGVELPIGVSTLGLFVLPDVPGCPVLKESWWHGTCLTPLWKGINGSPGPRAQSPEPRAVIMELRVLWVLAVVLTLLVSTSEARRYSKGEYLLAFLLQPGNECE